MRDRLAEIREKGKQVSGWDLGEALTSYSERGSDYVESLHAIMRINTLRPIDEAVLTGATGWEGHQRQTDLPGWREAPDAIGHPDLAYPKLCHCRVFHRHRHAAAVGLILSFPVG